MYLINDLGERIDLDERFDVNQIQELLNNQDNAGIDEYLESILVGQREVSAEVEEPDNSQVVEDESEIIAEDGLIVEGNPDDSAPLSEIEEKWYLYYSNMGVADKLARLQANKKAVYEIENKGFNKSLSDINSINEQLAGWNTKSTPKEGFANIVGDAKEVDKIYALTDIDNFGNDHDRYNQAISTIEMIDSYFDPEDRTITITPKPFNPNMRGNFVLNDAIEKLPVQDGNVEVTETEAPQEVSTAITPSTPQSETPAVQSGIVTADELIRNVSTPNTSAVQSGADRTTKAETPKASASTPRTSSPQTTVKTTASVAKPQATTTAKPKVSATPATSTTPKVASKEDLQKAVGAGRKANEDIIPIVGGVNKNQKEYVNGVLKQTDSKGNVHTYTKTSDGGRREVYDRVVNGKTEQVTKTYDKNGKLLDTKLTPIKEMILTRENKDALKKAEADKIRQESAKHAQIEREALRKKDEALTANFKKATSGGGDKPKPTTMNGLKIVRR